MDIIINKTRQQHRSKKTNGKKKEYRKPSTNRKTTNDSKHE